MSLDEFVEREREAAAIMEQAPPPIDNFYVPNGKIIHTVQQGCQPTPSPY